MRPTVITGHEARRAWGDDAVERIAALAQQGEFLVAAAESLTSGALASRIGAGPGASSWFLGGVVAYHESVKFDLLGVRRGPVVTESCARQMASGLAELLGADAAVATTGVGGPDSDEGCPPGTVIIALDLRGEVSCQEYVFDGDPPEVLDQAVDAALHQLAAGMEAIAGRFVPRV